MPAYRKAIHWFRRDLRLTDNTALHHASADAGMVIPVYILSQWKGSHRWTGPVRQSFLAGCLASLAANIEAAGGRLDERALAQSVAGRVAVMTAWYPVLYPELSSGRRHKLEGRLAWLRGQK
jgi:deoxyribodipyrimidine photolyase